MKWMFAFTIGILALTGAAVQRAGAADQTAKNLQILDKNMPAKELKAYMKAQAKMLGVQCDHCHDTNDFSKDTDAKKTGRWMMTLTRDINKKFNKSDMVTCATCHNGHEFPPMGGADLEKARAENKK